jgi:hypothetical protein
MITFIIIFSVSLLATLLFLYVRIHKIRTGEIKVSRNSSIQNRKVYTKVVETKAKTAWYGKNLFKIGVLLLLKLIVFAGFLFKQLAQEVSEYIKEKLTPKKNTSANQESSSTFLGTIREYKKEIAKFQRGLNKKND